LDKEFKKELQALEEKFEKLINPLYDRRRDIVQGVSEPTDEEMKEALSAETKEAKPEEKGEAKKEEKKEEKKDKDQENAKGIPGFWMEAFRHHDDFGETITKKDEAALKHLIDVRWTAVPNSEEKKWSSSSFVLEFEFAENPHFTNKVLSKTFFLLEDEQFGETIFDHLEASPIEWKAGKNLTVKMVPQQVEPKRGGRRGGKGRGGKAQGGKTVMVEEATESFFHFFSDNPLLGVEDDEEIDDSELQAIFENEYELGCIVKEQIISSAVLWFTGEIQQPMDEDESGEDEEGDEGEYDSAEDADFVPDPNAPGGPAGADGQKPECAQQ